jgi:cytochrome c5
MTWPSVFVASLPIAAAGLVVAAVTAGAQQSQPRDGEQVINASCNGACHDVRPIHTAAKNEDEWNETVERMLAQGATISDADKAILLPYLVRTHGPMPDGRGKDIVLDVCTMCHDLTRVKRVRHTPDEWEDLLETMLNEGAPLSDTDFPVVLNYLARNFGLE